MSTETTDETVSSTFELDTTAEDDDFEDSALFDFTMTFLMAGFSGFAGGVIFMMGWYGVLVAQYVPRVVIGAFAALILGIPVAFYWMLRTVYPDVFAELRQLPHRMQ